MIRDKIPEYIKSKKFVLRPFKKGDKFIDDYLFAAIK